MEATPVAKPPIETQNELPASSFLAYPHKETFHINPTSIETLESDDTQKSKKPIRSPLSLMMFTVIVFSAMTGLLMGYDLCIIAVILQPITDEFNACPQSGAKNRNLVSLEKIETYPRKLSDNSDFLNVKNEIGYNYTKPLYLRSNSVNHILMHNSSNSLWENQEYAIINSNKLQQNYDHFFDHISWTHHSKKPFFGPYLTSNISLNKAPCVLGNFCSLSSKKNIYRDTQKTSPVVKFSYPDTVSSNVYQRYLQEDSDEPIVFSENFQSCSGKQLFVSIVSPGAAIGSLLSGFIADAAGRKFTLALSDTLIMIGTLTMALSPYFSLIVFGRFILGLGIGTGFVIFSTYVSEISPNDRRGQLVSCQEVAQCLGCLAAYCVAAIAKTADGWRVMLVAAGIVAAVQILGILLLPESPRWLIQKNELEKAKASMRRLAGISSTLPAETDTYKELQKINKLDNIDASSKLGKMLEKERRQKKKTAQS